MQYLRVQWHHSHPDEPVDLYYEVDDRGANCRTVEIWADGHYGFADANHAAGGTGLAEGIFPDAVVIRSDPEFDLTDISQAEFNAMWAAAVRSSRVRPAPQPAGRA